MTDIESRYIALKEKYEILERKYRMVIESLSENRRQAISYLNALDDALGLERTIPDRGTRRKQRRLAHNRKNGV